jgi:hypothetical protein
MEVTFDARNWFGFGHQKPEEAATAESSLIVAELPRANAPKKASPRHEIEFLTRPT